MPVQLKSKVYKTMVRPVLQYVVKAEHLMKLEVMEMKYLRQVAGFTLWDRRNKEFKAEVQVAPIVEQVKENRLQWFRCPLEMVACSTGCSNSAECEPYRLNIVQLSHDDVNEEVITFPLNIKEEIPETLSDVKQEVTIKQEKVLEDSPVYFSIPGKQLLCVNDEFTFSGVAEGAISDKKHLYVTQSVMSSTSSSSSSAKLTRIRSFLKPKSKPGVSSTLSSSWVMPSKTELSENSSSGKEMCTPLPSLHSSSNDLARDGSAENSTSEPVPRFSDFMKDQLSELIAHQESLTGERSFKCITCEKSFPDQFTFIKHKFREHRQIHKARSFQATEVQCKSAPNEKLFTRLGSPSFSKHLLPKQNINSSNVDNSAQKLFACCVCAECFPDKSCLTKHLLTHTSLQEKPYSCTECEKCFPRKSELLKHARVHAEEDLEKLKTEDGPYQCFECGKRFTWRSKVNAHYRIHMDIKPYRCFICEKGFRTRADMNRHKWVHANEKPYNCTKCGKGFLRRYVLINHERMHSGEEPDASNIHVKSFVTVKNIGHVKIHAGNAPYSCSICGKSFLFRSYLVQHRQVHSGEKPFKSLVCGKRFQHKHSLLVHHRLHTGEKPYKCTECGKNFRRNCALKSHEKVHSG
ncbi:zinc finger protein 436-like [Protopterus annectens]|uniref:zinc finger protein 436-like n=1 Tax=Protopterus annectens TaxID=7888 RepID=UPI001CFB626C|nr:zinc finger protein 436-like [Protopterus annectens]